MKLYNFDLSPFAARVRLSIYAKGLAVDFVPPPESGIKGEEFLAMNPMGKVPVLVLDSGACLPESETILEYLEDAHPTPSLRPDGAEDLARARLVARVGDIYVLPPILALFGQMNPATREAEIVAKQMDTLGTALTYLDHYLSGGAYAVGAKVSTADCSVLPLLFFVNLMGNSFGQPDLISRNPKLSAYYTGAQQSPIVAKVYGEMQVGLAAMMKRNAGG
jgi:glutathione S-transferase